LKKHWALRNYPKYSGARRPILELLRADMRQSAHQSIALMTLCMIAHRRPEFRDSLLLAEALLVMRVHARTGVLSDDDESLGEDSPETQLANTRCEEIEKFCDAVQLEHADESLAELLDEIGDEWREALDEINAAR